MRLTMEELERLAVGQGPGTDTYRDVDSIETSQHVVWYQPTVASRIMNAVEQGGALMSRRQIADAIGVKKAPWVANAIEQLVSAGYLVKIEARTPQGVIMWLYEVRR